MPDEAAGLVRALLTADRNQQFLRLQMTEEQRAATPAVDYRPFIIADADTGHGGDPHVRNLIRRFVEAGVSGTIEDQRLGKKCGHQGGKVLVPSDEQIKRLNTARFQLDIMGVPGIIVARTDAEAANLVESRSDERDQPFLLGATNLKIPPTRRASWPWCGGSTTPVSPNSTATCSTHCPRASTPPPTHGSSGTASPRRSPGGGRLEDNRSGSLDALFDKVESRFVEAWQDDAGLETYGDAVAELLKFREGGASSST